MLLFWMLACDPAEIELGKGDDSTVDSTTTEIVVGPTILAAAKMCLPGTMWELPSAVLRWEVQALLSRHVKGT
jgi:hypothetical protein